MAELLELAKRLRESMGAFSAGIRAEAAAALEQAHDRIAASVEAMAEQHEINAGIRARAEAAENGACIHELIGDEYGHFECSAVLAAERRVEEAERVLREIVRRYDDYRGKGVMPTAGEYQMVVGGIEAARAFLATGKKEG